MVFNTARDSGLLFWRPPAGRCTIEGAFSSELLWGGGSYRILPLRKVDGIAFLIRGLYKKPIDLAAVQKQSLELWPESLKAGD